MSETFETLVPEPPSNVVGINGEIEIELRKQIEASRRPCAGLHKQVYVDPIERKVECKECGFVIDPFDYLLAWANDAERRMTGLRDIEAQRRIARNEHENLMRQIKNMRATLKRNGCPQPREERDLYDQQRWNPHIIRPVQKADETTA